MIKETLEAMMNFVESSTSKTKGASAKTLVKDYKKTNVRDKV